MMYRHILYYSGFTPFPGGLFCCRNTRQDTTQTMFAKTLGEVAKTFGEFAKTPGEVAKTLTGFAKTLGEVAKTLIEFAKTPGEAAKTLIGVAKTFGEFYKILAFWKRETLYKGRVTHLLTKEICQ
ncbi:hypothetical protein FACS1894200_12000 [Spirochaetia bacterium]|nr:hypothetical protein FACS1894200_12000 [Spirochaetia bacterium]